MPRFQFSLDPVLRLREHRRDLCREQVAAALAHDAELAAQQQALTNEREDVLAELRQLAQQSGFRVQGAAVRRYHAQILSSKLHQVAFQRQVAAQKIHEARQQLVAADQQVKALENLSIRRRHDFERAATQAEDLEREELWRAGQFQGRQP